MTVLLGSTILLGLAWFVAVNAAASLGAWIVARTAFVSRYRERAGWLLAIRLLPAAVSIAFVSACFVPSHWRFEPEGPDDSFGVVLYGLACLGAVMLGRGVWRGVSFMRASRALKRGTVDVPGVSLVGIWRTRVLIGQAVTGQLTRDELEAALAHEQAHHAARDNFKRFLIACAPDFFGRSSAAERLERAWRGTIETLADARAVRGDERRAVALASAVIKVARIASAAPPLMGAAAWSSLHDPPLIEMRVQRLVAAAAPSAAAPDSTGFRVRIVWILGLLAIASLIAGPTVHQMTEILAARLP